MNGSAGLTQIQVLRSMDGRQVKRPPYVLPNVFERMRASWSGTSKRSDFLEMIQVR